MRNKRERFLRTRSQKVKYKRVDAKVSEVVILRKAKHLWNRHPEKQGKYTLNK